MLPQQRYLNNLRLAASRRRLDPHWDNVVLLCDFNGADGSTTFTDLSDSAHTLTAFGNAQLDTAQFKFGTASLLLDGTGDEVQADSHADFDLGTGDFTIEVHVRASSAADGILAARRASGSSPAWAFYLPGSDNLSLWNDGFPRVVQTLVMDGSSWVHIAVSRNSGTVRMFADGVQLGSDATYTGAFTGIGVLEIGAQLANTVTHLDGHLDNIRITKGVGRYAGSFTPPDREYPTR